MDYTTKGTHERPYRILGLMSGSSLDGVDLAACEIHREGSTWKYEILKAETIEYDEAWRQKLKTAHLQETTALLKLHGEYGQWLGQISREWCKSYGLEMEVLASHGHTIFHAPARGYTFALGEISSIAAGWGKTVVANFRDLDVALGGQGAPLVPIGDELLFGDYAVCLNLGGFANVSYQVNGARKAFDVSPANLPLNHIANREGYPYDDGGQMARAGHPIPELVARWNGLAYYQSIPPKSLGREWMDKLFMPAVEEFLLIWPPADVLASLVEHISDQLAAVLNRPEVPTGDILITGGGAYNAYLIERTQSKLTKNECTLPGEDLIQFKEAMTFALLGALRLAGEINVLSSCTGARRDSVSGIVMGH